MGTYVAHASEGLIGGLLGTFAIHGLMGLESKLPEAIHGTEMKANPGEVVLSKGEKLVRLRVPDEHREKVTKGLGFGYGGSWGLALGLASPFVGVRSFGGAALAGAVMGTACWAAGFVGWLPATGVVEPIHRQGWNHAASTLGEHVIYGVLTGLAMHALDRVLAPKRGILDAIFPRKWSLWGMAREIFVD